MDVCPKFPLLKQLMHATSNSHPKSLKVHPQWVPLQAPCSWDLTAKDRQEKRMTLKLMLTKSIPLTFVLGLLEFISTLTLQHWVLLFLAIETSTSILHARLRKKGKIEQKLGMTLNTEAVSLRDENNCGSFRDSILESLCQEWWCWINRHWHDTSSWSTEQTVRANTCPHRIFTFPLRHPQHWALEPEQGLLLCTTVQGILLSPECLVPGVVKRWFSIRADPGDSSYSIPP